MNYSTSKPIHGAGTYLPFSSSGSSFWGITSIHVAAHQKSFQSASNSKVHVVLLKIEHVLCLPRRGVYYCIWCTCVLQCLRVPVAVPRPTHASMSKVATKSLGGPENGSITCVCICFLQRASKALELPDQVKEMRDHVLAPTLEKLKLDEAKSIG